MKTKDRNELIQKMLEFAHIKQDELTVIETNDQITVFHVIVRRKGFKTEELLPGVVRIVSFKGKKCEWFNDLTNQYSGRIEVDFEP